jgi:hypothetical protein
MPVARDKDRIACFVVTTSGGPSGWNNGWVYGKEAVKARRKRKKLLKGRKYRSWKIL